VTSLQRATRVIVLAIAPGIMGVGVVTCQDDSGRPAERLLFARSEYRLQCLLIRPLSGASLVSVV
jgi:hypothetical protein